MRIDGTNLFNNQQLFSSGSNQTFLGKLVVRDQEPDVTASVLDEGLTTQEELLEKLIKEAEKAEKALNSGYEIKTAPVVEEETEKPLSVLDIGDLASLRGVVGVDKYHLTEGLANFKGSGNATSDVDVREDLAARENWFFSWGRNMDMEANNILGTHGIAPTRNDGVDGFAMRVRYDDSSTVDNPAVMVEMLNNKGERSAYRVALNEVNASSATMIEAFAVITHLGMGQGNSDGIYKGFDVAALMGKFMDRPTLVRHDPNRDTAVTSGGNTVWVPAPPLEAPYGKILDFNQQVDFTSFLK